MLNLSASILWHAQTHPARLAVVYQNERINFGELAERVLSCAAHLKALGVGPDTIVAVLMKNSCAFIEIAAAVSHLGAVLLPINFRLAKAEVGYIIEHAGAGFLLVDEELYERAGGNVHVTVLDSSQQLDTRRLGGKADDSLRRPAARKPTDLYRLMYTSGTTGHPKGVIQTYGNLHFKSLDHIIALGLNETNRLLIVGPLYHVGALDLPGTTVLKLGGMLCILRDYDPVAVLSAIEREQLNCAWLAPVMLNGVLNLPDNQRFDVSSLKWCIGGGEKTPEPRIRAFTGLFKQGRYIDAYGLTETVGGDTFMEPGREIEKIGSTGRAVAHLELRIMDSSGQELPPGGEGEICLRGPKVTQGYWRDPAKTAASFFGDWFRTGDIGYVDTDGFLFLTDRLKDMIISGGENIASSEVERVIYELAQVNEAAVIGVPDERWGERPEAVVSLQAGTALDYEQLAAHCRERLAGFKVPKALHVRASLPRNASGKVLKRVLREELLGAPKP